jgi:putative transferase (TIGR04331 family)
MGWSNVENTKVIPIGNFKFRNIWRQPFSLKEHMLLITFNEPRYALRLSSESALNITKHLDESFVFLAGLNGPIQSRVLVRLTPAEKGWYFAQRWQDRFPKVKIDHGAKHIYKSMKKARLVVITYNQTSFLETMAFGIPTILFCDLDRTPLNSDAALYYAQLREVGIFHDTPESAAAHANKVWDNVDKWWSDPTLQKAVEHFTQTYSRRSTSIFADVQAVFKHAIAERRSFAK